MRTAIGIVLAVAMVAAFVVPLLCARARRNKLPVKFKNADELGPVADVAWWAREQMSADDPRRELLRPLYLDPGNVMAFLFVGLSAQALAVLAPFIDRVIAGDGPPFPIPAEYDDRAEVLGAFKARMQAAGVWPRKVHAAAPPV
jgi:hypothetical protein